MNESNLHNYQKAGVAHIIRHKFCGLFLEMGLGKTVTTLTAINDLLFDYLEIRNVLVIAPKRVAESVWEQEAAKWGHLKHLRFSKIIGTAQQRTQAANTKADIYIVSRDNIAWLCALWGGMRLPYDMVVIDELSSFKSHKSIRFKAMRAVRPSIKRLVGLTGTPASNGLIDLWAQMFLIDRGERLEKTITRYRETYFVPGKSNGNVVFSYSLKPGAEAVIRDKIKDICISMTSSDYISLPERIDNYIDIDMPQELKRTYKDFEREKVLELYDSSEKGSGITVANAAALSNKLLQFANGAIYDENHNVYSIHDLKLEALKDIVENANGQPVLVAWTYQFDRDRIKEYLKAYEPRELKTDRDIQDWNTGRVSVMLAHPASAGHGLNLQAGGNIIVWYGQTWSLELYQQFNARLYRQGQKHGVIINHLVMKGTHDEDVIRALKAKGRTQDQLMASIKAKIENYLKMR